MQDLNDMAFFAEVVDRGSFAAAARALGVPKSRLSRRVAGLEAQLGVRLLQRTTRKLSLTAAGEVYHRHCAAMREAADAAGEAIAQVRSEPRGTVRMVCPVSLAQGWVGALLPIFLARHPQVRVEMQVSNRVVDLVEEGVDLALRVRATLQDSATLVVKPLGRSTGRVYASPALLARVGEPADPAAAQRLLPTIAMSAADGRSSWTLIGPGGESVDWPHRPVFVADDLVTLKYAALGGIGAASLPDFIVCHEVRQGLLRPLLPGWAPPPGVVHAVFPSRRGLLPAVRRLLDFLAEHWADEPLATPAAR